MIATDGRGDASRAPPTTVDNCLVCRTSAVAPHTEERSRGCLLLTLAALTSMSTCRYEGLQTWSDPSFRGGLLGALAWLGVRMGAGNVRNGPSGYETRQTSPRTSSA